MTVLFKDEEILASFIYICAFALSNCLLLIRHNVWCWGDVDELDSTLSHKALIVREADRWQTLTEHEVWFYDRTLSGAMETLGGVSDTRTSQKKQFLS